MVFLLCKYFVSHESFSIISKLIQHQFTLIFKRENLTISHNAKLSSDRAIGATKIDSIVNVASPRSIANFIAKIPYGSEKSVKLMRRELAENANADNTCPLTCGIFLRIAIEASIEQSNGVKPDLPFWRVIDRNSSLIKKLPISEKDLTKLRNSEGLR